MSEVGKDVLNILGKWKIISTFKAKGRRPQLLRQMEDNLKFLGKWNTTQLWLNTA
jgi:hypothetical protein